MSELQDLFAHLGDQVHKLFGLLYIAGDRFTTNLSASFSTMELKHWIRVVMIVGTYLLIRPHIVKFGARQQQKQFEKGHEEADVAALSPNQLRGQVEIPDESDEEEQQDQAAATASTTSSDWGKKARKRQRVMLKKMIDAEEKRLQELQEDEEDKDIEQYLR